LSKIAYSNFQPTPHWWGGLDYGSHENVDVNTRTVFSYVNTCYCRSNVAGLHLVFTVVFNLGM